MFSLDSSIRQKQPAWRSRHKSRPHAVDHCPTRLPLSPWLISSATEWRLGAVPWLLRVWAHLVFSQSASVAVGLMSRFCVPLRRPCIDVDGRDSVTETALQVSCVMHTLCTQLCSSSREPAPEISGRRTRVLRTRCGWRFDTSSASARPNCPVLFPSSSVSRGCAGPN